LVFIGIARHACAGNATAAIRVLQRVIAANLQPAT
jgi:hypothetical protein